MDSIQIRYYICINNDNDKNNDNKFMNTVQKVNPSELKEKVLQLKPWLPSKYASLVIEKLPYLAITPARIYNVVRLTATDAEITDVLQKIAIENGMPIDSLPAA